MRPNNSVIFLFLNHLVSHHLVSLEQLCIFQGPFSVISSAGDPHWVTVYIIVAHSCLSS